MADLLRAESLSQQVVNRISRQIVAGELQPGDRLPNERQLAEDFGVSRTVIREAMKSLANSGMVVVQTGRGTFVADAASDALTRAFEFLMGFGETGGMMADVVEIREILEPEIATRAAIKATEEDIEALKSAAKSMDESMDDAERYIQADSEFHVALANATHNLLTRRLLYSIVDVLNELRMHIFRVSGGPERGQEHHWKIIEAVSNHDPKTARAAMEAHLEQVREDSERAIEEPGAGSSSWEGGEN